MTATPQNAQTWLFDLDGTLVNSAPLHEAAYCAVLAQQRPDLLVGFRYEDVAGLSTRDTFAAMGLDDGAVQHLMGLKQRLYRNSIASLQAMPGAAALLERLQARGCVIGIVTGASRVSALQALQHTGLSDFVSTLVAADDVLHGKPDPEGFQAAMEALQADPARTLAIEDSETGVAAARAAGLTVLGVHNCSLHQQTHLFFDDLHQISGAVTP